MGRTGGGGAATFAFGGAMAAKPAKKKPAKKKPVKKPAKKAGKKPAIGKNGKPKKKKKAKDPNKPKRAMVAFMYFSIDQRPVMQRQNPTQKIADISKMLGAQWRSMSATQKAPYDKKAAADKKRYEKEMKSYTPPYKPKRAMVAFMFFSIEQRPAVQKKNPSLGIADISKVLGQQWRGMSATQKGPYEEKAAKDKMRYEREMKSFKK